MLPADDLAHVVVAAVEHVPLGSFAVRPASKSAPHLEPLRERVTARLDATLCELRGWLLAERGVAVSLVTVWRALARLGLTLTESRSVLPSRTAPT